MANSPQDVLLTQFRQALNDCEHVYRAAGKLCSEQHPDLIPGSPEQFVRLMDDLHKGLVVKIFVEIAEADRRWSRVERTLVRELFQHVWQRDLNGEELSEAVVHVSAQSGSISWFSLVRPFARISPLRPFVGEIETVVMRLANLVARADGDLAQSETRHLRSLQEEFDRHFKSIQLDGTADHEDELQLSTEAVRELPDDVSQVRQRCEISADGGSDRADRVEPTPQELLEDALRSLDELIGMDVVKLEVKSLTNFLQMQRQRREMDLPETTVSLHMVFAGNPGTGKTTVARIVGRIFGAMGILKKGHVVETDRSGLVARYAGQTAVKTGKKIDEAMDGVLFVDEAYSLVSDSGDDAYGSEAVQALLKRMEDDRHRLVVILAGYPEPMKGLIRSNPGLSSRFQKTITFPDYNSRELCRIFEKLCRTSHYQIPPTVRAKLMWGFQRLYDERDEHFGNGRLVRNEFEEAIRRLANRVAGVKSLTKELLTVLDCADIAMDQIPAELWCGVKLDDLNFLVQCPGCKSRSRIPTAFLGKRLKCKSCGSRLKADWGDLTGR